MKSNRRKLFVVVNTKIKKRLLNMDKTETELLDVYNLIEVQKMRQLLIEHPDLLAMFECMMIIINTRLNAE